MASDIDGGSTDNCGIQLLQATPRQFDCNDIGSNTVVLSVLDHSFNQATCTANVEVEDNLAPVANCKDITVNLSAIGNATIVAGDVDNGSADNCSSVSLSVSPTTFDCSNVGPVTVTLTVSDVRGNTSTCTATVTVEDNVAPTLSTCPSNIFESVTTGCDTTITWTPPTATDNCSVSSLTSNINSGATFPIGTTTVTYTATDPSGNTDICSFTVTISEDGAPTAICKDVTVSVEC